MFPNAPKKGLWKNVVGVTTVFFLFFCFLIFGDLWKNFDQPKIVELENGESIRSFSQKLKEEKVIISSSAFVSLVVALGGEKKAVAGPYFFKESMSIFSVAKRLLQGDFDVKATRLTIPEGWNTLQIATRAESLFPHFNKQKFIEENKMEEGYLFPDTYFFLPTATEENIILKMKETFEEKTKEILPFAKESAEFRKAIILASILEKEVQTKEDMAIVAGIFQNRIKIGMALQADSTLAYILNKDSLSLSLDDLKVSSPYNSYTNRGLPPTAIGNPGLTAIKAALNPTKSDYLYFLTDKEGKVYYAKTFEEHKKNKLRYLK